MNNQVKGQVVGKLESLAKQAGCALTIAPEESRRWLAKNSGLSADIVDFLSSSWPDDTLYFGPYRLDTLSDISDSERSKLAFAGGFFYIGATGNGDLLVIRQGSGGLEECEIGLISHEELWDEQSDLGTIYAPICRGFMNLLDAAETDRLPRDYCDAQQKLNT